MILKALGGLLAIAGGVCAATGVVYTVAVDQHTGRLIRVPARQLTRTVSTRSVQPAPVRGRVVEAREVKPVDPAAQPAENVATSGALDEAIARLAYAHGIRPSFVHALIKAESNYDPRAISYKGAVGLMQLMPHTAVRFGVRNRFDALQNLEGGVRYLRFLLDTYEGDGNLALAAYNAGEGAVDRFGGIPPYRETRQFVPRVNRYYARFRPFDRPPEPEPPPKRFEGPRIFQVTGQDGITRYTTESP